MATLPTPNDLTRQQLDELDALLQRMLSLPLNKSDTVKVPPAPALPLPEPAASPARASFSLWRADAAPATKSPYIAAEPEPALAFAPSFAAAVSSHAGGTGTLRGVDAPATPYGYNRVFDHHDAESAAPVPNAFARYDLADVNPFAEAPGSTPLPPAPVRASGVPFFAWPVVACNWMIESALAWTGPVGAVAQTPAMKHLLGVVGLGLMVGAGIWTAKGMGWIALPK